MTKTDWQKELEHKIRARVWQIIDNLIYFHSTSKERKEIRNELRAGLANFVFHLLADQKAEDYRKIRAGLKKIGETSEGTFPVGFWDEVWQLLDELEKGE